MGVYIQFAVDELFNFLGGFETMTEDNSHSYALSCIGLDIYGPKFKVEDNKLSMSIEIDKTSKYVSELDKSYCDDIKGEGWMTNPSFMKSSLSQTWYAEVEQKLSREKRYFRSYWLNWLLYDKWLDWENKTAKHLVSPFLHLISSHYYLQDWCIENYPDMEPSKCAWTFTFFKPHNYYDRAGKSKDFTKIKKRFMKKDIDFMSDADL